MISVSVSELVKVDVGGEVNTKGVKYMIALYACGVLQFVKQTVRPYSADYS